MCQTPLYIIYIYIYIYIYIIFNTPVLVMGLSWGYRGYRAIGFIVAIGVIGGLYGL